MDTRGQPVQVGVIILFGFLIVAFALFQAVIVPQQNAEVEFQHSQRVQSDVVDVRNAVLTGVSTGSAPFVEVELGTQYPPRVFAVNPGQPSGTLRTTSLQSMTIEEGGTDVSNSVCPGTAASRTLEYSATYNVYTSPTVYVDNTVAYLSAQDTMVPLSDQRLLSGSTVNLVPLRGEYQASSSDTTSVGPVPGNVIVTTLTDPTITVPTQLSQSVWDDLVASELDSGESATVDSDADTLTLDLQGDYDVVCSPVGVNGAPPSGARNGGGFGGDGGGSDVNPSGADDVVLTRVSSVANDQIAIKLRNDGDTDLEIKQGRVPFTYLPNKNVNNRDPTYVLLNGSYNLSVRGDYEPLNQTPTYTLEADGGTTTILFDFDEQTNVKDLFFGVSFVYSNGVESQYFVDVGDGDTSSGDNSGNAAGNVTVSGSSALGTNNQTLQFTLDNANSFDAAVTQIKLNDTSSNAQEVFAGSAVELTDNRTGNLLNVSTALEIKKQSPPTALDSVSTLPANEQTTFELTDFQKANGNDADLAGESVTITLYFDDGSAETYTIGPL